MLKMMLAALFALSVAACATTKPGNCVTPDGVSVSCK
jgi:hypothetical protein